MAHHQQTNHDRMLAAQGLSSNNFRGSASTATAGGDDELASDVDEPPDEQIQFKKVKTPSIRKFDTCIGHDYITSSNLAQDRKESLLTQALLSSPEMNPMSGTEPPMLTSDGGMTSPARTTTPSPPLPTAQTRLDIGASQEHQSHHTDHASEAVRIAPVASSELSHESSVEAGLGRKRCISFACGRQSTTRKNSDGSTVTQAVTEKPTKTVSPPKRPCMLKFVCPTKPSRTDAQKSALKEDPPIPAMKDPRTLENKSVDMIQGTGARTHQDSDSTIKSSPSQNIPLHPTAIQSRKGRSFNRVDFQKSEATRFFEFGCHFSTEDEWTNEQTAFRQKITVNDTLRKENAIRKLAEEAEEEAIDEETGQDIASDEDEGDDLIYDYKGAMSDDGNESDDEEGFADSDDESDDSSDYQFWTPGLTTAATSTDHVEHIRPVAHRVASDSSFGSVINTKKSHGARTSEGSHAKPSKMRSGTPNLPDTSDFVVGTVDEDRHLEEAYMSCLEERRRSKHHLLPQDIDPSFPTSEPDADNNNNDGDSEDDVATNLGNTSKWGRGHPETSEGEVSPQRTQELVASPRGLQLPLPQRVSVHRSPPPRRLFAQCAHRLRSPPPTHRKLISPPSSRRPSWSASSSMSGLCIGMPHLAQRPNLTHTTSLPRTPNPFWGQHRRSRFHGMDTPSAGTSPKSMNPHRTNSHSRGPIDIVQGLEARRQRRKEKFWRQHCRTAGKEKYRRCQPGKGAERMKELGLEMADRCRGYGQKAQLVLSI